MRAALSRAVLQKRDIAVLFSYTAIEQSSGNKRRPAFEIGPLPIGTGTCKSCQSKRKSCAHIAFPVADRNHRLGKHAGRQGDLFYLIQVWSQICLAPCLWRKRCSTRRLSIYAPRRLRCLSLESL